MFRNTFIDRLAKRRRLTKETKVRLERAQRNYAERQVTQFLMMYDEETIGTPEEFRQMLEDNHRG